MTCRSCRIAGYLQEESPEHDKDTACHILGLARMWHDRCNSPCDCEHR